LAQAKLFCTTLFQTLTDDPDIEELRRIARERRRSRPLREAKRPTSASTDRRATVQPRASAVPPPAAQARDVDRSHRTDSAAARRQQSTSQPSARTTTRSTRRRVRPFGILGGVGLIVSAFLEWVLGIGISARGFSIDFLLQTHSAGTNVRLMPVLLGLGALAIFFSLVAPWPPMRLLVGLVAVAIPLAFAWRAYEWTGCWCIDHPRDLVRIARDFKDLLGPGVYVTFVSGVLVLHG
jgi:hypothetical protein